jgi:eukaryotic-like serine/threonine-protein kinase
MGAMDPDPMIGQTIGRYQIVRALGEGGMGRVYSAVNPDIGSRVAIKVLHGDGARNEELVQRFFSEAKTVNLIRHENIVNILDFSALPDGSPFIVMEHLEGAPLSKLIAPDAKLPIAGVARVALDVLAALDAAHAAGVVHRDLKPDNIFVTPEGNGKVLDFGIAKLAPGHDTTKTREGLVYGTPLYMSPEQVTQSELDARSDIYSLGVVLYEACTGSLPYTANTTFEILSAHVDQQPAPPRSRRADLGDAMEQLILRALAKDPAQRFPSAIDMASALSNAVRDLPDEPLVVKSTRRASAPIATAKVGSTTGPTTPSQATPAPAATTRTYERYRARARWPMYAGAGALVVVLALGLALCR